MKNAHKVREFNRFMLQFSYKIHSNDKGVYIPVNIDTLIEKIYVSPYASEWFFDVVKNVVEKYSIKAEVTYSMMKALMTI